MLETLGPSNSLSYFSVLVHIWSFPFVLVPPDPAEPRQARLSIKLHK